MFEKLANLLGPKDSESNMMEQAPIDTAMPQVSESLNGAMLENLLQQLAYSPEESRYSNLRALYAEFLRSPVLVPITPPVTEGGPAQLLAIENPMQKRGVPVFTSEAAFAAWNTTGFGATMISFMELCSQATKGNLDYVLVNLAGPFGGEITAPEFRYLAEGVMPPPQRNPHRVVPLEKNTEMLLGQMETPPPAELMERLNELFNVCQLVEAAYVFQLSIAGGPIHMAMAIRMPEACEASWEPELLPQVLNTLQEVLGRQEYVDLFFLNQSGDLETALQQFSEPFYNQPN